MLPAPTPQSDEIARQLVISTFWNAITPANYPAHAAVVARIKMHSRKGPRPLLAQIADTLFSEDNKMYPIAHRIIDSHFDPETMRREGKAVVDWLRVLPRDAETSVDEVVRFGMDTLFWVLYCTLELAGEDARVLDEYLLTFVVERHLGMFGELFVGQNGWRV